MRKISLANCAWLVTALATTPLWLTAPTHADPVELTWDNGAVGNTNWSDQANWDPDGDPQDILAGKLIFGPTGDTATVNPASGTWTETPNLEFTNDFTLEGGADDDKLEFYNSHGVRSIVVTEGVADINLDVVRRGTTFIVFEAQGGSLNLNGDVDLAGGDGSERFLAASGQAITLNDSVYISSGRTEKNGGGELVLATDTAFNGNGILNLNRGALVLANPTTQSVQVRAQAGTKLVARGGDRDMEGDIRVDGGTFSFLGDGHLVYRGNINSVDQRATLYKHGTGTLSLLSNSTINGDFHLTDGELQLGDNEALGDAKLVVRGGQLTPIGYRDISNDLMITSRLVVDSTSGGGGLRTDGTVTIRGQGGQRLHINAPTEFAGEVTGHNFTKTGEGTLTLSGNNTYVGRALVRAGELHANGGDALPDEAWLEITDGKVVLNAGENATAGASETVGALRGSPTQPNPEAVGLDLHGSDLVVNVAEAHQKHGFRNGIEDTFEYAQGDRRARLIKDGEGALSLAGDLDYRGETLLRAGGLWLRDGSLGGSVRVEHGQLLLGQGQYVRSDVRVNGGEMLVQQSADVLGNVTTAGGDVRLSFDQFAGSTAPPSFDRLNVAGNFTVADGDTLYIDIGANGKSDVVDAAGSAELQSGSTLKVVEAEAKFREEEQYTVIRSNDLSNEVTLDASDIDPQIAMSDDGHNLYLSLGQGAGANTGGNSSSDTSGDSPAGMYEQASAGSRNAAVGRALDSVEDPEMLHQVGPTTGSNVRRFADTVNDGGQSAAIDRNVTDRVNQAFTANRSSYLAARRSGSPAMAMKNDGLLRGNGGSGHRPMLASAATDPQLLASVMGQTPDAGPNGNAFLNGEDNDGPEFGGFAKAFGLRTDIDRTDDRTGYQANTYGVQSGIDWQLSDQLLVGLSLGYANTDAELNASLGDVESNAYRVGPYASFTQDQWFVDTSLTYGYHDEESTRNNGMGGQVNGDFSAHDVSAFVGGGYDFELDNGLTLTPTASLQYTYYNREAYTESGMGALSYDERETHTLNSRLGGQVSYAFEFDRFTLIPEIAAGWEHEYLQDDDAVEAQFAVGSGTFDIDTAAPEQDSAFIAAGLSALVSENASAFVKYEGNFGSDTTIHGVAGGLTFSF